MKEAECPVEAYARSVVDGKIVAGRLVRLACQRHLRDLETGPARGLKWDALKSLRTLKFFSFLRLPCDGEVDGKAFDLQGFQQFIIGSLFGWTLVDGSRRFRTAYVEIGKGNGKTPLAAGIGLKGLLGDGEAAAEIYPAATTREQAGILFRDAKRMAEASPALRSKLDIGLHNLSFPANDSFLRPVSSEHRGLDGKRPHMALIDEVHEHPSALVVDKMRAGTKGRKQALIFEITNSGYDRNSVCWHHHDYSAKILEGYLENDSWFAYVCQLDPCESCREAGKVQPSDGCPDCDNWQDEKVWLKANPGLDTILPSKYLREQVAEAQGMPTKEGIVKRLNFCVWTEVVARAIPMDKWDLCGSPVDPEEWKGKLCFGGLDIGATSDFTAFVLMFPHDDEEEVSVSDPQAGPSELPTVIIRKSYTVLPFFWLPEQNLKRDSRMKATIDLWRRSGLIRTTSGDTVDYDVVFEDIIKLAGEYDIAEIAIDRGFQGAAISTSLMAHFGGEKVVAFPQSIFMMATPFRELIELVTLGKLHHGGNPVLRWMAANTAAEERSGMSKPSKDRSSDKIDGITAAVMAIGRAMLRPAGAGSLYDSQGIDCI